jgi:Protein  of unknown function (DUF3018)
MSESRVARWRQRLREQGLKAVTVWLSVDEELRVKDLATTWHTTPSAIMQQALAQFHPGQPPRLSYDTDIEPRQRSDVPDMTQIQAWLQAELPGMVRQCIEQFTIDTLRAGPRPSAEDSGVSDDELMQGSDVPDMSQIHSSVDTDTDSATQPQKRIGRRRSPLGQRILDLLGAHPEGLTAEQIRGHLAPTRPLGDLLAGMRKTGAVQSRGAGRQQRYVLPLGS